MIFKVPLFGGGSYPSVVVFIGTKHRVQSPLERWPSMVTMNRPKMESRPYEFLLHSPVLMLLTHIMSTFIGIYCTLALRPPIWENDINLRVTKFITHCKIQGPQSRTIKTTITVVNTVFHPSPKIEPKSRKECFHLTLLFPGFSCHLKQPIHCQISQECIHNIQP